MTRVEKDELDPQDGTVLRVETHLRPWLVWARCGHAWKSRARLGRVRCRACEIDLRERAAAASAEALAEQRA